MNNEKGASSLLFYLERKMERISYLNNNGSRWIIFDDYDYKRKMQFALFRKGKLFKVRQAICYEAFGNFAMTIFKLGKETFAAIPNGKWNDIPRIDIEKIKKRSK